MCVCVCVCLKENQIKQQKTTKCHSTTNCCIFDNSGGPRRRRNFDQPKRRDETFLPPPSSLSLPPAASPMTYRPLPDWLSLCRTPLHRLTCFWFGRSSFSISPSLPYLFFFFFIYFCLCADDDASFSWLPFPGLTVGSLTWCLFFIPYNCMMTNFLLTDWLKTKLACTVVCVCVTQWDGRLQWLQTDDSTRPRRCCSRPGPRPRPTGIWWKRGRRTAGLRFTYHSTTARRYPFRFHKRTHQVIKRKKK